MPVERVEIEHGEASCFEHGAEVVVRCATAWCDGESGWVVGQLVHGFVTVQLAPERGRFLARPWQIRRVGEVCRAR